MRRLALTIAAVLLMGAGKPETVDYRLGFELQAGETPPTAVIEIRFRGDADGETRLELPDKWASGRDLWRYIYDLQVSGAQVREDGPAVRVLSHKPNARVTVRYRVRSAYATDPVGADGNPYKGPLIRPQWMALAGEHVFASPADRGEAPATFRWGRIPKGWRMASDLEHGALGQPLTVDGAIHSITMGGPRLNIVERPIQGGTLRFAAPDGAPYPAEATADQVARVVTAERRYWSDLSGPYFVGFVPLISERKWKSMGGTGRDDGFILYATEDVGDRLLTTIAHENTHSWIPGRIGRMGAKDAALRYWFSEGFTDFFTHRALLRDGMATPAEWVMRLDEALVAYDANPLKTAPAARILKDFWTDPNVEKLPYQRGALLALKWDEDIRRKTGGKADLDDVILRMRDHYQQFPAGQGPDVVTGLVSAAWVVAQIDLRPDIARYADGGALIPLPEQMFDGCLDARVTVTPGFDAGFDHAASQAGKVVKGVRRRGPAWNSGLRDGMRIESMKLTPGDMTREIELVVRPARGGRARTLRFWPYGDVDVETRRLQLAHGLAGEALAACGRRIAGL